MPQYLQDFFKKPGGRYKRIRLGCKGKPLPEYYDLQVEKLKEPEQMSMKGEADLFYGDESHICSEGHVPCGWRFPGEEICIPSEKAYKINCLGLIDRQCSRHWKTAGQNIGAGFVLEYPENLSLQIHKQTFVVLDNASVHKANVIQERIPYRQSRGLYIMLLPPYSPHLNIAETLWRKLKKEWIGPQDYLSRDSLLRYKQISGGPGNSLVHQILKF